MTKGVRILVVDDDPLWLHPTSHWLESAGYEVMEAATGEDGLHLVQEKRPDLILLGVNLPDVSGIEVCRRIKADTQLTGSFVTILSGTRTASDNQAEGLEAGADEYIIRPISNRELVARVQAMVRIQQTEKALRQSKVELELLNQQLQTSLEELAVTEEELRQNNEELAATHHIAEAERQRYQNLFNFAPDGYLVTDTEGSIQEANRAGAALLGVRQDFLVGRPLVMFVAEPDRKAFHTRVTSLQQSGTNAERVQGWQISLQSRDGKIFPTALTVALVRDADGRLIGLHWLLRDVTEHKRAEDRLRQQNEYLAALHETSLGLMNRLQVSDLLEALVARAVELVGATYGWLYLVESGEEMLQVKVGTGIFQAYVGHQLKRGEGLAGQIWQTGQPQVVDDYAAWSGRSPSYPPALAAAAAGVPLKSGSQVVGVLGVTRSQGGRTFGDDEVGLLSRFAQLASIALDNARLHTSAQQELAERKRAEQDLRESEVRYRSLFVAAQRQAQELELLDRVRTAIARESDLPVILHTVVEAIAETFGYTQVSLYLLRGETLVLQHQVGYSHVLAHIPITQGVMARAVRTGQPVLLQDVHTDPAFLGAIEGIVSQVSVPLLDQGQVVGALNVESTHGVTLTEADLRLVMALGEHVSIALGKARLYMQVRESERLYRLIAENATDVIWIRDLNLRVTYTSPSVTRLRGYSVEEASTQTLPEILTPASEHVARQFFLDMLALVQNARPNELAGQSRSLELEMRCKNGSTVWTEVSMTFLFDPDGKPDAILGVTHDITERKRAEAQLRASLRDKEALLKEVHHRVKNNMQIISSLLHLQSDRTQDPQVLQALQDSQGRIFSMALVHEWLYQSQDLASIDLAGYVRELTGHLSAMLTGTGAAAVELNVPAEEVTLDLDTAIPCGLIITELVTNALKYAIPKGLERQAREIRVELRTDGNRLQLVIADNGVGLPVDLDWQTTPSLGLRLVNLLVTQIKGTLELSRGAGTVWTITFNRPPLRE